MTTTKNVVEIYLKAAGFVGPKPIIKPEEKKPAPQPSEDPLIRYLQSSGYGPRRV